MNDAAPKRGGGRPTKLTPELQELLCRIISEGNYLETACAIAGIRRQTVRNWMRTGARQKRGAKREFLDAIKKAFATAEAKNVRIIATAASEQWTAAAWMLERKYPKRWGRNDKVRNEVTGKNGGAVETKQTIEMVEFERALNKIYGDDAGNNATN